MSLEWAGARRAHSFITYPCVTLLESTYHPTTCPESLRIGRDSSAALPGTLRVVNVPDFRENPLFRHPTNKFHDFLAVVDAKRHGGHADAKRHGRRAASEVDLGELSVLVQESDARSWIRFEFRSRRRSGYPESIPKVTDAVASG